MGPAADGSKSNPGKPLPAPPAAAGGQGDDSGLKGHGQPPLPLMENDKVIGRVKVDGQFALTRHYTERAVRFLRDHQGSKGQTLEGGIRVPTLAWWPGKIPAGTRSDAITSMMDVLPTFARLAGAKVPADRKIDGVDLWPVLAGDAAAKPPRDHFFYFRGLQLEAVRSGPWKLHLARDKQAPQLYHLGTDIGESKNVAHEHPEEVQRLRELAATMKDDLGLEGGGPGCRPLGRAENPRPLMSADGRVRADAAGEVKRFP